MRAFIYTGGVVYADGVTELPAEGDLVIAADSGYRTAQAFGVHPNVLLGDFDSLGEPDVPEGCEVIRVPVQKDETDTQLAVEKAIEMGATDIVIIGSTAGRFDHAMSTLAILENLHSRHIRAQIVNGQNRVCFIKNTNHIVLRSQYKYFSLIATDKAKGVSIEGAIYPLKSKTLDRMLQYAISNEVDGNAALITVKKGGLFI